MNQANLQDGTPVFCLRKRDAYMLDKRIDSYLQHGIFFEEHDVIFDIGTNIGLFGVRAFQRHRAIRVFAFEPIPAVYEVLKANAAKFGGKQFHAINCALSSRATEQIFTHYPSAPAFTTAYAYEWDSYPMEFRRAIEGHLRSAPKLHKLLPPRLMSSFVANQMRSKAQQLRCPTHTISEIIRQYELPRIDLLKITSEGAELDILRGIATEHWIKIRKFVIQVRDIDGRLETIKQLLISKNVSNITIEQEKGFEKSSIVNLFAYR